MSNELEKMETAYKQAHGSMRFEEDPDAFPDIMRAIAKDIRAGAVGESHARYLEQAAQFYEEPFFAGRVLGRIRSDLKSEMSRKNGRRGGLPPGTGRKRLKVEVGKGGGKTSSRKKANLVSEIDYKDIPKDALVVNPDQAPSVVKTMGDGDVFYVRVMKENLDTAMSELAVRR